MKNTEKRNELRDKYNVISMEMEAAGIMNQILVSVIWGFVIMKRNIKQGMATVCCSYGSGLCYGNLILDFTQKWGSTAYLYPD